MNQFGDRVEMKISLKRYIFFMMSLLVFCTFIIAILLWHAEQSAIKNASDLTSVVEIIAAAQRIGQNLNIHHRQALLRGLRTDEERQFQIETTKRNLLISIDEASRFEYSWKADDLIENVRTRLNTYFFNLIRIADQGCAHLNFTIRFQNNTMKLKAQFRSLLIRILSEP